MELKIELSAFIEMITDAHMAGQHDAGCPHASYGNARAYYTHDVENKIKNLSERSEPPTRCCAVLATPKFRIEKRQRDNYLWIEKENGEGTEISYDEFDKNFEKLFNNIM